MSEMWELDRAPVGDRRYASGKRLLDPSTSDLHAWSIFRQNLNSDFTDSALGAEERSPLPYGNFTLKEETVNSIMSNPRLGPRSELASNAFSYLKFGLPRVLPPSASAKEGSRDSSGDEEDERRHPGQRPGQRARSETDIRTDGVVMNRFRRRAHPQASGMRQAISEGNILSPTKGGPRWLGKASDGHGQGQNPSFFQNLSSPNTTYAQGGALPHLLVRRLCVGDGKGESLLVDHVSFELRRGEMMALMPTNASEGTALLEGLAGKRRLAGGEFALNGNNINAMRLGRRLGFLRKGIQLHLELNPKETLRYYAAFKRISETPPNSDKVDALLDFLGLSGVGNSMVCNLTGGEKQRLAVGCQMILETQILLLDSPTNNMDIFDTFFLMSLVEEWTRGGGGWNGGGGIAIVTIHPPTFEVFSTFSKVLLLSGGRTLFYGHRTELLPYFAFIDYPCPPFKNPSDYYIDLVTRDDLSNEALQESSLRIQGLAEAWSRRQELPSSDHGPPQSLPPPLRRPKGAILGEILLLWRYIGLFGFRSRFLTWFLIFLSAGSISILLGIIYWDVRLGIPAHVNSAYDRLGLHWSVLSLLPFPLYLLLLAKERNENSAIESDIEEGLYSRAAPFLAQRLGEFVLVACLLAVFVVPGTVMGGVKDTEALLLSTAYTILCLYTILTGLRAIDLLCGRSIGGLTLGIIILFVLSLSGGYLIHRKDLGEWVAWTEFLSPFGWLLSPIARIEFRNTSFEICSNPIIQLRGNLLMRELSCGLGRGESVIGHFDFTAKPVFLPLLVCTGFILISDLIALLVILTSSSRKPVDTLSSYKP